jgi:hypothetical protein
MTTNIQTAERILDIGAGVLDGLIELGMVASAGTLPIAQAL